MKRQLLFVLFVFLSAAVFASAAPKSQIKGMPKKSVEAFCPSDVSVRMEKNADLILKESGYGQKQAQGYWDVLSDRNNNKTYTAADCSDEFGELSFGQKVRIAKIKKDAALVYSIPDTEQAFPAVPAPELCLGWIPMSTLILNTNSLISHIGNDVRILLCDGLDFKSVFYDNPVESTKSLDAEVMPMMYLVKSENGASLVSNSISVTQESLLGWIKNGEHIIWQYRLAVEPTWEPADISYFEENSKICEMRYRQNEENAGKIQFKLSERYPFDCDNYKMRQNEWRFPVYYQANNSTGCLIPSYADYLDSRSPVFRTKSDGMVNIFFVIEGSRMYDEFIPVITESLSSLPDVIGSPTQVGALIYHDARNQDNVMEKFQLIDSDDTSLYEFIDRGGKYGYSDNISQAPLSTVLSSALDFAGFNPQDANFIVVIGGCGDSSDSENDLESISSKLNGCGASLYAIQLNNEQRMPTYRDFKYYLEDVMMRRLVEKDGQSVCQQRGKDETGKVVTSFLNKNDGVAYFDGMCSLENGLMGESFFEKCYHSVIERIRDFSLREGKTGGQVIPAFREIVCPASEDGRAFFKQSVLYSREELDGLVSLFSQLAEYAAGNIFEDRSIFLRLLGNEIDRNPSSFLTGKSVEEYGVLEVFRFIEGLELGQNEYKGVTVKELLSKNGFPDLRIKYFLDGVCRKYNQLLMVVNTPSIYRAHINGQEYFWVPADFLM